MSVPIFLKEKSEIVYFPPKQNKMTTFNQKYYKEKKSHKNKTVTEKGKKIRLHMKSKFLLKTRVHAEQKLTHEKSVLFLNELFLSSVFLDLYITISSVLTNQETTSLSQFPRCHTAAQFQPNKKCCGGGPFHANKWRLKKLWLQVNLARLPFSW